MFGPCESAAGKVEALAWSDENCRGPVVKIFTVSPDCQMEDAGLVWVVQVGRLEQELHHPLLWQGWQSGQEVVLSHCEGLLNLKNGVPVPNKTNDKFLIFIF